MVNVRKPDLIFSFELSPRKAKSSSALILCFHRKKASQSLGVFWRRLWGKALH